MHRLNWPALVLASLALTHAAAHAQSRNPLGPGQALAKRQPELPPSASGIAWPRLDPGAVLCRTQEDLRRRNEVLASRASGNQGPTGPAPSCRIIAVPTPIDIVERPLPSATQVRLKAQQAPGTPAVEVGWTDAWLPEKAPR